MAAVVLAAAASTAIVALAAYSVSPLYEYIARPWLLMLDLAAAAAIAGTCAAAALLSRPPRAVVGCGLAATAVLADAWIGHNLGSELQAFGFAAVPVLPAALAFAPAAAGVRGSRAARLATRFVLATAALAAFASVVLHNPYLDPSCQRDCLPNPLLVVNSPDVVRALRLVEAAAAVGWCLVAVRDLVRRYSVPLILGASAVAVVASTLRLVTLTLVEDDPGRPWLRVLHTAAAGSMIIVAAAIAHELRRVPRVRARLDELLRDLLAAENLGLERCLQLAARDDALTLAYTHPSTGGVFVDARGAPVSDAHFDGRDRTEIRLAGEAVAVLMHPGSAISPGQLGAALGTAAAMALDNERLRAATLYDLARRRAASVKLIEVGDAERTRIERKPSRRGPARSHRHRADPPAGGYSAPGSGTRRGARGARAARLGCALDRARDPPHCARQRGARPRSGNKGRRDVQTRGHASSRSRSRTTPRRSRNLRVRDGSGGDRQRDSHGAGRVQIDAQILAGNLRVEVVDDGPGGAKLRAGGGLEAIHDRSLALGGTLTVDSPAGGRTSLVLVVPSIPFDGLGRAKTALGL